MNIAQEGDLSADLRTVSETPKSGNVSAYGDCIDIRDILNDTGIVSSGDATRAVHQYYRAQHEKKYGT